MWASPNKPQRSKQLFKEDLEKLSKGTIIILRSTCCALEPIWFKFVRKEKFFYIDSNGKPDSSYLTDWGCIPYEKAGWNMVNWIESL